MDDELPRLLAGGTGPLVQSVLASAKLDAPTLANARRSARALGLPLSAAAIALTSTSTSSAATLLPWLFAKWFAAGAGVGLVVTGTVATLESRTRSPAEPPALSVSGSRPADDDARRPPGSNVRSAPSADPIEPVRSRSARSARARSPELPVEAPKLEASGSAVPPAPPAAPGGVDDSLARELELLAGARSALRSGDGVRALRELDRYESEAPSRRMASESTLLRVRALMKLGRRAEAEALVANHLARHPNDAYTRKLSDIVGPAR